MDNTRNSFLRQCNYLGKEVLCNHKSRRQNLSWQTALSAGWNVARSQCPSCVVFAERIVPGILDYGEKHELLIWKAAYVMPLTLCFGIRSWWKVRKTWRLTFKKGFTYFLFPDIWSNTFQNVSNYNSYFLVRMCYK